MRIILVPVFFAAALLASGCDGGNQADRGRSGEGEGEGERHTELSASLGVVCALKSTGALTCWGALREFDNVLPPAGDFYAEVSVGDDHACARRKDGTVTCWGVNLSGQSEAPEGTFKAVSAGHEKTCGLRTDGSLFCWGDPFHDVEPPAAGTFVEVSVGNGSACALNERGEAVCWGTPGTQEYLSNNVFRAIEAPSEEYHGLDIFAEYACALRVDDSIRCWGWSNEVDVSAAPVGSFVQVSTGSLHACALDIDGRVTCWGDNTFHQLDVPDEVQGRVISVAVAGYATCAVTAVDTKDDVVCWGDNEVAFNLPADL